MIRQFMCILMLLCISLWGNAQELQFNQWEFAPALLSPSLTGAYPGSFRVGAIAKDRYGTWNGKSWKTTEAFIDAPIVRGLRKSDWIGVGVGFDLDQAGSGNLNQQYSRLSLAYHLGFGKKYKKSLSIGGQFTNANQKVSNSFIDEQDLHTGSNDNIMSFFQSANNMPLEQSYKTWTASLAYSAQMNKNTSMEMGLSMAQFLNSDNQAFQGVDNLPSRWIGFFRMVSKTGKRSTFEPSVVYSRQGANDKLYLRGMFGYMLKSQYKINYGIGINTLTSLGVPIYFGMEKNRIKAGLAYAIDLGATGGSNTYGGLELGVSYVHLLSKKPKPKTIIICPRL